LDHGGLGHGNTLFEEQVHIPFVLIAPGYLTRSEVATPISLVDVLPTMLDLAGAPPHEGVAGRSLTPLLRGEPLPARDVVLESGRNDVVVRGLISDGLKYGTMLTPVSVERLFDLDADPGEAHDLMPSMGGVARAMRRRLDDALDAALSRRPTPSGPAPTLTPEDVTRLRALGYAH
jgi:choline-sulfatase